MRNEMKRKYEPIVNELKSEIPKNMKEKNIPGLTIALISKKGTRLPSVICSPTPLDCLEKQEWGASSIMYPAPSKSTFKVSQGRG